LLNIQHTIGNKKKQPVLSPQNNHLHISFLLFIIVAYPFIQTILSSFNMSRNLKTNALLIGINYTDSECPLRGCHNDVQRMYATVRKHLKASVRVMTDEPPFDCNWPTRRNIVKALKRLAANRRRCDRSIVHFSGHGTQIWDVSGDEPDGLDEALCPVNFESADMVADDTLANILLNSKTLPREHVTLCVMDCCHSGSVLDLGYSVKLPTRTLNGKWRLNKQQHRATDKSVGYCVMFSGCRDRQTSADAYINQSQQFEGAMTNALMAATENGVLLTTKPLIGILRDMTKYLDQGGYTQRPQLACNHLLHKNACLDNMQCLCC
jgi:hypothetical protein